MNRNQVVTATIIAACLSLLLAPPAIAANATQSSSLAGQLGIAGTSLEPQILMRGDTGILTISVKNNGNEAVTVKRAILTLQELSVLNYNAYSTTMTIGPGSTMDFSFTIRADPRDGIYYPRFYLDLSTESFSYYVPVRIESTPIDISIKSAPDVFTKGVKDEVTLVIGNPRGNTLKGVTVTPIGESVISTQSRAFVGDLEPGASSEVTFEIGSMREGAITFLVEYWNGMNRHNATIEVPVVFGTSGKAANPVINNIELAMSGGVYTLSADVTNAGLEDARSIVVTTGEPAQPADPYPVYVVGTLEADDFSSFDLTFTLPQDANSVPVVLSYRDGKGNEFTKIFQVSLRGSAPSDGSGAFTGQSGSSSAGFTNPVSSNRQMRGGNLFMGLGSGFSRIPYLEIALVIAACAALIIAWRKGYITSIARRMKR